MLGLRKPRENRDYSSHGGRDIFSFYINKLNGREGPCANKCAHFRKANSINIIPIRVEGDSGGLTNQL